MEKLKQELARVFDDNLRTKQWQNYVDYTIIALILLSTLEVFLSTYDNIVEKYGSVLKVIDYFTTIFFTIEVTLRIWAADRIDPKYKGFVGRIRYCFSFYGLIDILATYPFYLHLFMPIPYVALKALRIARLLRIFRYVKAFDVLSRALKSKKDEMVVSLQFLCIITVLLSFILFFVEHEAQPEVYDNGWTSVLWAFAQYIGDPGGFADTPPITICGRVIACIIGVLGIAIFAVPAGLVASAFSEVMEKDEKKDKLANYAHDINEMMLVKSIKREGIFWPQKNISFGDLKLDLGMSEDEIIKAVSDCPNLRIKNLSAAITDGPKNDMLVVNQFYINNEYGCHIERGSSVTLVNPMGIGDNGLSFFDWHIAQLGGFNYVANENFSRTAARRDRRCNFYTISDETKHNESWQTFTHDILIGRTKKDWIIVLCGEQIVKNAETDLHFCFGGEKGETRFDFPENIVHDAALLKQLYDDMKITLEERTGLKIDAHQVQPVIAKNNLVRYLATNSEANVLLVNVSYRLMIFNNALLHTAICTIAEVLNRNLENNKPHQLHKDEYNQRPIESEYWRNLYLPDSPQ